MTDERQEDAIDRLERGLYGNREERGHHNEHTLEGRVLSVRRGWRHDQTPEEVHESAILAGGTRRLKASHYALMGSLAFFLISTGVAAYFFFGGANLVSPRKIDITIEGPVGLDAGEELPLQITIRNHNAAALEGADMVIEFPAGTRSALNPNEEFLRYREALGDIAPGRAEERTVRALVYGEQGERRTIVVRVEYHVAGSNGVFVKEQSYDVVIGTPSVRVSVESIEEVNAGQEMVFTIEVASNADTPIDNMILLAEYPSGFAFTTSSPDPSVGTSLWRIGTLKPEERQTITLRGVVDGQDGDERVFRFTAGIGDTTDEVRITTALLSTLRHVSIKKPFVGIGLFVNGARAGEHAVQSNGMVRVEIDWVNNLPTRIIDTQIEAVLSGDAFDRQSVRTTNGLYRSNDHTVLWNAQTLPELLEIESGERGRLSFTFSMRDYTRLEGGNALEPWASIAVNVRGRRVSESAVPETIVSSAATRLNIMSDTQLSARAVHHSGPFTNTGPLPPKAETETTYTILWSVTNTTSDISGAEVSVTLPANVRWVGPVAPDSERVTFAPVGGKVTWSLGKILAGTGGARPPREVAFQVALTPSITDVGAESLLTRDAQLRGTDTFTGTAVLDGARELTIRLVTEPGFDFDDATVVP